MSRHRGSLYGAVVWTVLSFCGPALAVDSPSTVILIAMDGVRHDYPDRASLPGLERMAREGARATRLIPTHPSSTFPAMTTLATGTHADRHGIVDNVFWDRDRGLFERGADPNWYMAEPLWAAAERQSVAAAAFFWVGSEGPWRGTAASYYRSPFDSDIPESVKVDQIVDWLDLPRDERPRLIMAWWHGADRPGHLRGPDHASVIEALAGQDEELVRLQSAIDERELWATTTLIVVSDHGMATITGFVDVNGALDAADIDARTTLGVGVAHVFLRDPGDAERAVATVRKLDGVTVYRREDLPTELRLGHPTRTGDLVLTAEPPLSLRPPPAGFGTLMAAARLFGAVAGGHGYRPELPDMAGIFYAQGRGVPSGARLGAVRAIDVAPTAARLLGIDPPAQAEGSPIVGIGGTPR